MSKKTICPNCGFIHATEEAGSKAGAFENRVRRPTFRTDTMAPAMQQPGIAEQPTGLPNWDSHVKIPLRQAVIFGLFDAPLGVGIGLLGGASLAMLFNVGSEDSLTLWGYALFTGTGGAIGGLVALCQEAKRRWPERLAEYDALLWIEEITGLDLDGDGEIGEPVAEVLRIELQDQQGRPRLIADLDTDPERFAEMARLVVQLDLGFSEEVARKAGYNRKEWEKLRDTFIELRGARWKEESNHKLGLYLSETGYKLFGKILSPALPAGDTPKKGLGTVERTRTNENTGK
jgi:hypothetical protein